MAKPRILIVEDERIIAEDMDAILRRLNYQPVGIMATGKEAVKAARDLTPDLILMDIVLKGTMDGIAAAGRIRKFSDVPIIFVTAYGDEAMVNRAKRTSPSGYLVKPFTDRDLLSAIEMALYQHQMEKRLRKSEKWLTSILTGINDAVIATNRKGEIIFLNPVAERLTGWPKNEAVGKPIEKVFHIEHEITSEQAENPVEIVLKKRRSVELGNQIVLISREGKKIPIAHSGAPLCDDSGKIEGVVLIFRDVSESRKKEENIRFLNRLLRSIRDINQLIVLEKDEKKLLQKACDLLSQINQYRFVWIGKQNHATGRVVPVAQSGFEKDYLKNIVITWDNTPTGKGPTGTAFRTAKSVFMRDILTDPAFAHWRPEALKQGYKSSAAFPMIYEKKIYGVLNVYSDRVNAFEKEEIDLLDEVARDLGFALFSLKLAKEKEQSERDREEKEAKYRALFEEAGDMIFLSEIDEKGFPIIVDVNHLALEKTGYSREELVGQTFDVLDDEANRNKIGERAKRLLEKGSISFETTHVRKDGTHFEVDVHARLLKLDGKKFLFSVERDISEKKQILESLERSEQTYRSIFDNAIDAIYIQDREGRFLAVNRAAEKMYGYSREEFLGRTPEFVSAPDKNDLKAVAQMVEKAFAGEPQQFEFWGRRKNGEIFPKIVRLSKGNYFGQDVVVAFALDVTREKLVEKRLADVHAIYRQAIESAHGVPYRLNLLTGEYDFVGREIKDLFGVRPEEMTATKMKELVQELRVADSSTTASVEEYGRLSRNGKLKHYSMDMRILTPDGVTRWVNDSAVPIRDAQTGQVVATLGILQDITERKQQEILLREKEQRFRTIFQTGPDAISINRIEDGVYLEINDRFTELVGYAREEIIGKSVMDVHLWADRERQADFLKELWQKGEVQNFKARFRVKSGAIRIGSISARRIDLGGIPCVISLARDITEVKQAEEQINRLAEVVQQAHEAVVITDLNAKIQYVNPAFERLTGYTAEEAVGKNPRILKSGKHGREFYQTLWKTIKSGKPWHGTFMNQKKNGELFWEDATIFPIKNPAGEMIAYAAVKRDITKERHLEEQLRQSQKLEAVGQLAGGIAHDFNNILTAINGYSEMLLMDLEPEDPRRGDVEEILKAGNRAARLTRQLLAFGRKQVIHPEVLNVNAQIHESMGMLRRLIGENMNLQLQLSPEVWTIKADRSQFEQILINLIVNARDAIEEARTRASEMKITIETANFTLDEQYVAEHAGARPGQFVMLAVSDTGKGMDEDVLSHIFEPFFTTKGLSRGTGLGLATIYGIVKQNGGSIYVYSEPEKGTTFKILWPAATEEEMHEKEKQVDEEALRGSETILVAEDEDEIRTFIQRGLKRLGYKVLPAANGKEALVLLDAQSEPIDLLFTDVIMPQMDGRELADVVTDRMPHVKVLFASGYTDNHIAHRGILDKGIHFINKPFSIEQVAQKIRHILDEK